jgi:hypothetical protein
MAITKSIVFRTIGIADADGTNVTQYPLHVTESASVAITTTSDVVDDGQTLPAYCDVEFSAISYNTNIFNDSRVYTNAASEPLFATLVLTGATGAQSVNVTDTIVSGSFLYDGNRRGIQLTCTKRGVAPDLVVVNT